MKLEDIVKTARQTNSSAFGKVKDERAVKILRAAFQHVNSHLESAGAGNVTVGGLGRFAIKNVELEKDGAKVMKRRVLYRQPKVTKKGKDDADQS